MKKIRIWLLLVLLLSCFGLFAQSRSGVTEHRTGRTYEINSLVSKGGVIYVAKNKNISTPPSSDWAVYPETGAIEVDPLFTAWNKQDGIFILENQILDLSHVDSTDISNMGFITDAGAHTIDTDTQLTEAQVDAYVNNNGYSTGAHTVDTDTQLTDGEIGAMGYIKTFTETDPIYSAWDKDYNDLINKPVIPEGGTDDQTLSLIGNALSIESGNTVNINEANIGDLSHTIDTDTHIDSLGIVGLGFVAGAHTIDTDTQLTEAQVDAYANNNGYSTGAHFAPSNLLADYSFTDNSTNWNTAFSWGNHALAGYSTGAHTVDTDTQLSQAQVGTYATAEGFIKTYSETDPIYSASQASNITAQNITNLGNLSGVNTGDQDISGISTNASAISTLQANNTGTNTGDQDLSSYSQSDRIKGKIEVGTTYTVTGADFGYIIYFDNASPVTVTIPDTLTGVDYQTFSVAQKGAGQVTVITSGTASILSAKTTIKTFEQFSALQFIQIGADSDDWHVIGGLENN